MSNKTCEYCMHYWYDNTVDASDCEKADAMTEEVFEKHFVNNEEGCPHFEEFFEEDYPIEDDYTGTMPCDISGFCAGYGGCSKFPECAGWIKDEKGETTNE